MSTHIRYEAAAVAKALEAVLAKVVEISKTVSHFCDAPLSASPRGALEDLADASCAIGAHGIATYIHALIESVLIVEAMARRGDPKSLVIAKVKTFQVHVFALGKYIEETLEGKSPPVRALRAEFERVHRENHPEMLASLGADALAATMATSLVVGTEAGIDPFFDGSASVDELLAALERFERGEPFVARRVPLLGIGLLMRLFECVSASGNDYLGQKARAAASVLREGIANRSAVLIDWRNVSQIAYALSKQDAPSQSVISILRDLEVSTATAAVANHDVMKRVLEKIRELQSLFAKAVSQRSSSMIDAPAKIVAEKVAEFAVPALTFHSAKFSELCATMAANGNETWRQWVEGAKRLILMEEAVVGWGSPKTQEALLSASVDLGDVNQFMTERAARHAFKAFKAAVIKETASMRTAVSHVLQMMLKGADEKSNAAILAATRDEITKCAPIIQTFFWSAGCPHLEREATEIERDLVDSGTLTFIKVKEISERLTAIDAAINSLVFGNQADVDQEFGAPLSADDTESSVALEISVGESVLAASTREDESAEVGQLDQGETPEVGQSDSDVTAEDDVDPPSIGTPKTEEDTFSFDDPWAAAEPEKKEGGPEIVSTFVSEEERTGARNKVDVESVDTVLAGIIVEECEGCVFEVNDALNRAGVDQDDYAAVKRHVHTMKGVLRTCGLMDCGDALHRLEDKLDELHSEDGARFIEVNESAFRELLSYIDVSLDLPRVVAGKASVARTLSECWGSGSSEPAAALTLEANEPVEARSQADLCSLPADDVSEIPPEDASHSIMAAEAPDETSEDAVRDEAVTTIEVNESVPEFDPEVELAPGVGIEPPTETKPPLVATAPIPAESLPKLREDSRSGLEARVQEPKDPKSVNKLVRIESNALQSVAGRAGDAERTALTLNQGLDSLASQIAEIHALVEKAERFVKNLSIVSAEDAAQKGLHNGGLDSFGPLQSINAGFSETVRDLSMFVSEAAASVASLKASSRQSLKQSENLGSRVNEMFMVGLKSHEARMRMTVELAARDLGKKVELSVEPSALLPAASLDKAMSAIEHILRNAVAHGVEAPEVRLGLGKPAVGRITVKGLPARDGMVALAISDDGAGINKRKVLERALTNRILKSTEGLSEQDILQLIMVPGFSTAETVTAVAGRGVGMDVARDIVVGEGGSLTIASTEGRGATFTILVPSGESMIHAVPVWAFEQQCLIPAAFVVRVLAIDEVVNEGGYAKLREGLAKIVDLPEMLPVAPLDGFEYERVAVITRDPTGLKVVIVNKVGHKIRVTPKPLPANVSPVPGVMGIAMVGTKEVALIVNPGLMVKAKRGDAGASVKPVALVVDDSPTIRAVNARALETEGFTVISAKDGAAAFKLLQANDAIIAMVTDIEMPGMNGLDLLREIRSGACGRKDLPAIIVSSRTAEAQKAAAKELGVELVGKPADPVAVAKKLRALL